MKTYHMTADGVLVVAPVKLVQTKSFQRSLRAARRIMELQRKKDTQAPAPGQEGGDRG